MDREINVYALPTALVYGLTSKWTLFGVLPYVIKEVRVGQTDETTRFEGLADSRFFARYTFYQNDGVPLKINRASVFGGLELPTGDEDFSSKSTDPFAGLVWTWQDNRHQINVDASYQLNTESSEDVKAGDVFKTNLAYEYRLSPGRFPDHPPYTQFNGILEINGQQVQQTQIEGDAVKDSGGHTLFFSPGLQWASERVILETSVQLPIYQELNGNQVETASVITAGFRVNF